MQVIGVEAREPPSSYVALQMTRCSQHRLNAFPGNQYAVELILEEITVDFKITASKQSYNAPLHSLKHHADQERTFDRLTSSSGCR